MRDPFANFDRDFARDGRSFRRMQIIVTVMIAAIWIAIITGFVVGGVVLYRVGPTGLAKEAGHLFSTFSAASQERQP